jgi:NitT/TauT family transport system substrate-binding protein
MSRFKTFGFLAVISLSMILASNVSSPKLFAQTKKPKFTLMWSIYVGWMPWPYAAEAGIIKKWADKYGIEIEVRQADYIPSIEAYVAGKADACVMTNMECLNMPSTSGIDNTVAIIGDFSNGNDALFTRDNLQVSQLRSKNVLLVELSVSHYLLARALEIYFQCFRESRGDMEPDCAGDRTNTGRNAGVRLCHDSW